MRRYVIFDLKSSIWGCFMKMHEFSENGFFGSNAPKSPTYVFFSKCQLVLQFFQHREGTLIFFGYFCKYTKNTYVCFQFGIWKIEIYGGGDFDFNNGQSKIRKFGFWNKLNQSQI